MNTVTQLVLSAALALSTNQAAKANISDFFTALSNTESAVAVDLLIGEQDLNGVRLAYRPHIYTLTDVPYFNYLDVYWEVSANFWEYGANNQHETNYALAISPVIGKTFYHVNDKYPVKWEFGIGISFVNDTRFAGKDIGSHYQFEDRLGLTMDFGTEMEQSVSLRYMHYSNGGLNSKNPGLDFLNVSYAHRY
ncbi:acyloxyacyl hydrolase [Glaciecola sp. XM2]|uniref:acyloxyacyl hydrolase n=1 Tax=Glaciecola sp. XM2 TaxID=1914931 RepID=UPI001BDE04A0|nr:acyloxyacyl hydrolase [Glaciecola sp. XM2]MBT1450005.1 acyloxyacyl hydrolase [Glaciecola sp. XM2]